jgi:predicted TIM-barrel fold metal-dependent hydrolase
VVVVQPSFYGIDNRCTLEAVQAVGKNARAVVVINKATSDQEIERMVAQGARGVRMNIETSGSTFDASHLQQEITELANRVKAFNLHIQIYASAKLIASVSDAILRSPVPIVLDHFAGVQAKDYLKNPDLPVILELIKSGQVYVKLSGVYRVAKPDYSEVNDLARLYLDSNSDRMVWASDWPHTNTIPGTPYDQVTAYRDINDLQVFNLIPQWAPNHQVREKLLTLNAQRLYAF